MTQTAANPVRGLTTRYVIVVTIAMVVGAGIFKSPALVAANAGSEGMVYLLWLVGGAISLMGALCYSELAAAFAHPGGDYHFLERAWGRRFAFLFAWARFAVINTGAIALLGFVIGDYMNRVISLGPHGPAIYAFASVALLTAIKLRPAGEASDSGLVVGLLIGLLFLVGAGVKLAMQGAPPLAPGEAASPSLGGIGYGLVFVLLAYGGWTESATLSAEVKDGERGMVRALIASIAIITALYLLVAWAMLRGLGLEGLSQSSAPAADLMARAFGPSAGVVLALTVVAAAATSVNTTIIAGARTTYAGTARLPSLKWIGRWNETTRSPRNAILAQGAVSLALVGFGAAYKGFETLVDYTAPVYWIFLIASGAALLRLRATAPDAPRPFRVPLYPALPLLFILSSGAMLVSAILYVQGGAFFGLGILAAGGIALWVAGPESP
ncbi:amino acid permease [Hyphomonas sp. WL0036]|uniref:APC family permease n=1 Tax=Hyphomonas sediminis TaxID=2866160 RepID=UPI001C813A9C|nr:amino acid permease [Hyphomonas sediminis]